MAMRETSLFPLADNVIDGENPFFLGFPNVLHTGPYHPSDPHQSSSVRASCDKAVTEDPSPLASFLALWGKACLGS